MFIKPITVLLMCLCGVGGGIVSRLIPLGKPEAIRTSRLIIADPASQSTAEIGLSTGGMVLSFKDAKGVVRAEFGTSAGSSVPYLLMRGEDDVERVAIRLTSDAGRPVIVLGDELQNRVSLGFDQQDTFSPQGSDFWSLRFTAPSGVSRHTVAAIGMGPEIRLIPLSESVPSKTEYRGAVAVRSLSGDERTLLPTDRRAANLSLQRLP
jgi:hypothetical protein